MLSARLQHLDALLDLLVEEYLREIEAGAIHVDDEARAPAKETRAPSEDIRHAEDNPGAA